MGGAEVVLLSFIIAVARKVGDKWIDKIAGSVDTKLVALLKSALSNPQQAKVVQSYLESDSSLVSQLSNNLQSTLDDAKIANPITTLLMLPEHGTRLTYYKAVIEWIIEARGRLGRDMVLKGFFNGDLFLAYIIVRSDDARSNLSIEDGYLHFGGTGFRGIYGTYSRAIEIYLEKMSSIEERDRKFISINDELERSKYGEMDQRRYLSSNVLKRWQIRRVAAIYEKWVAYTDAGSIVDWKKDFASLSKGMQQEQSITSYAPLSGMLASIYELIVLEAEDIVKLRQVVNGLKP